MSSLVHWCRETEQLELRLQKLGRGPLAVDTEADSLHHYPEKVCLVQLSFAGLDLLVDPLAGVDLRRLGPVLGDRSVRKVLHGADYDLRILERDFGLEIRGLFDTMIAARLVGERAFGLAALLERRFGVTLHKRYQRADWSRRPLPAEMEQYAAMDTRYLSELARQLEQRLNDLGRAEWAREEFSVLEGVRWRSRPEAEAFRKIAGSHRLDRRGLAVLRELVNLRERLACQADRPPFMILRNDLLLRLAQQRPTRPGQLDPLVGARRRTRWWTPEQWLTAVARGLELPEPELPQKPSADKRRPPPAIRARLRVLLRKRDALARELDLDPGVVASRAVLQSIVTREERGLEPRETPGLKRWQWQLLEPLVRDA